MTLLAATLATELKNTGLYTTEAEAIDAWASAYKTYMLGATSNAIVITPAALDAAKLAMVGALTGLSVNGATALQAGIVAFWGAIVPATAWLTVTVITPPVLLTGLTAALTSVFASNKTGSLSKNDSMDTIAGAIHTNSLGGTATWPTPVGPQPIL